MDMSALWAEIEQHAIPKHPPPGFVEVAEIAERANLSRPFVHSALAKHNIKRILIRRPTGHPVYCYDLREIVEKEIFK